MTQSRHAEDSTPIPKQITNGDFSAYPVDQIFMGSDDAKHSLSQFHHAKGMLKPSMGRSRIDEMGQSKLVDMPQTLKCPRIKDLPLFSIQAGEDMNGITDFVDIFCHLGLPDSKSSLPLPFPTSYPTEGTWADTALPSSPSLQSVDHDARR